MGKIVDQSEHRIQAHMDQRTHMQHLTDIPETWRRGKGERRHMGGHQSREGPVGPTYQSADHHGPAPTDLQPLQEASY